MLCCLVYFCFVKQKTAYEMRISDWSSDVCSSDLYGDARTLERRAQAMEAWLANPELLEADKDAEYAEVIEIDLADVKEPVLCAPNDPDDEIGRASCRRRVCQYV